MRRDRHRRLDKRQVKLEALRLRMMDMSKLDKDEVKEKLKELIGGVE